MDCGGRVVAVWQPKRSGFQVPSAGRHSCRALRSCPERRDAHGMPAARRPIGSASAMGLASSQNRRMKSAAPSYLLQGLDRGPWCSVCEAVRDGPPVCIAHKSGCQLRPRICPMQLPLRGSSRFVWDGAVVAVLGSSGCSSPGSGGGQVGSYREVRALADACEP